MTDRLPSESRLGRQLETQLDSYDPSLIRRVRAWSDPAGAGPRYTYTGYVVVGDGAAAAYTPKRLPCITRLKPGDRRRLTRSLASLPAGPAFCMVVVMKRADHPNKSLAGSDLNTPLIGGLCDTFANAAGGYGANVIALVRAGTRASIVPDGVASVVLRYRRHAPITARVHDNVYWVRTPQLPSPPPGVTRPAALRRTILRALPTSIEWLAADHSVVRRFTPPAAYVRFLTRWYEECIASGCGD